MKEVQQQLIENNIAAGAIWSMNNEDHPMSEQQKEWRAYVLTYETLPPDLDVLIINKSYETSINLFGELYAIFVNIGDEDTVIQVRGRYRGDLPALYVYSQDQSNIEVPEEYIGVPLYTEQQEQLAKDLNIRKNSCLIKFRSIKELLINQGYMLEKERYKNRWYYLIHKPDS